MKNNAALVILIIAFFLLSGCATLYNPATGRNEFIIINTETEVAMGKNVAREVTKKHPLSQNIEMRNRAETVGRRLAAVSDRKDLEYKFYVLKDKTLNALALPGGFIYINEGLISLIDDDELAYVLGHEIGHSAARHIAKKIQSNMAYQLILGIAFAGARGSSATSSAVDIARGVDTIYSLIDLGYSRKDEYEADRLGVKYAQKAGFNPDAALLALEKIKKLEGPDWKILGYFRSHPYADERIAALKKIIPRLGDREKK